MKIGVSSALSHALDVADEFDVQIALHADTLNEAGFMEDTMAAVKDRGTSYVPY